MISHDRRESLSIEIAMAFEEGATRDEIDEIAEEEMVLDAERRREEAKAVTFSSCSLDREKKLTPDEKAKVIGAMAEMARCLVEKPPSAIPERHGQFGCVRLAGHKTGACTTVPDLAKKLDEEERRMAR